MKIYVEFLNGGDILGGSELPQLQYISDHPGVVSEDHDAFHDDPSARALRRYARIVLDQQIWIQIEIGDICESEHAVEYGRGQNDIQTPLTLCENPRDIGDWMMAVR